MIKFISNKIKCADNSTNRILVQSKLLRKNTNGVYYDATTQRSFHEIKSSDDLMFVKLTFNDLHSKEVITNLKMLINVEGRNRTFLKVIKCRNSNIDDAILLVDQIVATNEFSDSLQISVTYHENDNLYLDLSSIATDISKENDSLMFAIKFITSSGSLKITQPNKLVETNESILAVISEVCGTNALYKFDENDFGNNGKVSINLFDGTPNYSVPLFSTLGKRMPISLSLFHNPNSNNLYKHMPFGVVPSFYYEITVNAGLVEIRDPANNNAAYRKLEIPSDTEEKKAYLKTLGIKEISNYNGVYYSDMDNSYLFTFAENSIDKIEVHDKNGNVMLFEHNSLYRLKEIRNFLGHWIRFTWNGNKLNKLQNIDGDEMIFSYAGEYLSKVQIPSLYKCYRFIYSTANAISILENDYALSSSNTEVYSLLNSTKLVFDSTKLVKVLDGNSNYFLEINYVDGTNKVLDIALYNDTGSEKKYNTTYTYFDKCTMVNDAEANKLYYYFDNFGRCVTIMDGGGRTVTYNYDKYENGLSKHLVGQSHVQTNTVNLVDNHSFERDIYIDTHSLSWYKSSAEVAAIEEGGVYGGKCLRVEGSSTEKAWVKQDIYSPTSGTYKLRAFIKHNNLSNADLSNINVGFESSYYENAYNPFAFNPGTPLYPSFVQDNHYCTIKNNNDNWYEITGSILIPEGVTDISLAVVIRINNLQTTLYVDEVEVCKSKYNIRNNLIDNSSLNYIVGGIPLYWETENIRGGDGCVTISSSDEHNLILGKNTFKFVAGDVLLDIVEGKYVPKKRKLFQQIAITGITNEEFIYSVYGKANVSDNTVFRSFLIFNCTDGTQEPYYFDFEKHFENWQMLTRGVVVNKNFNSVIVGVEYDGSVDAFVDSFGLYKDTFGTTYSYDNFGNIIDVVNNESSTSVMTYNVDNKLETFSSSNGTFFRYIYDTKGRLSKIEDIKGNVCEYIYDDEDQIIQQIVTTIDGSAIINSTTYDSDNKKETHVDEFNKATVLVKDYLDRVTSQKYNNQLENLYQYNSQSQLTQLTGVLSTLERANNKLQYDKLGNVSIMDADNGTQYELIYDTFGNITQVKCCGEVLQTNTYSPANADGYSKALLLSSQTGAGDIYHFDYDSENRLSKIKINDSILCEYLYDEDGKVLRVSDKVLNKDYHYSYDLSGNVEHVYTEDGNSYKYNYDNLNNIQKSIYKINGRYRSVDYQYRYDMSEYTQEGFIKTFAERKGDDVVVGFDMDKGLYGLESVVKNVSVDYDSTYDLRVAKFDKTNSTVVFDLSTCNATRRWGRGGRLASWEHYFGVNKAFFMWIKPQNMYAQQDIFVLEKVTTSDGTYSNPSVLAKIRVLSDGKLAYYSCSSNTNVIVSTDTIKLNQWNFVGFHIQKDLSGNDAGSLVLNDAIEHGIVNESVGGITHIAIAKSGYNNPAIGTSLTMPFDFAFMSVGAEWYDYAKTELLYREGKRLMFSGQKYQSNATIYYDNELYKNFDVITFNGSLESAKGMRPVSICELTSKTEYLSRRIFKYDPSTKKQVLGVYLPEFEISLENSIKLGYKLNLDSSGTISLWFKPDTAALSMGWRTLMSFSDTVWNRLGVYINPGLNLSYECSGTMYDTTTFVSLDRWHHLGISFKSNKLIISLDGQKVVDVNKSVSLSDQIAYIGTNVATELCEGKEANAFFEMFAYSKIFSDEATLKLLAERGQSTIIRDDIDSTGRIVSKEIDVSGNSYSVNYTYNKTRISNETDSAGETIQYGYSSNYGILGQIIHKKGDQEMYREQVGYDKLLRIISETDEMGGSHAYTYDDNGNMLRHTCIRNGNELDFRYTYDATIKDKLLHVDEMKKGELSATIDYSPTNKFLPIKIRHGDGSTWNLSWQGKRLTRIDGVNIVTYVYNAQGLRTSKIVNGDTTSYLYDGTKVIQMVKNVGESKYVIDFVYDANGALLGLNTEEGQYFYRRDITGKITGILDSNGNYVVRYRYDAWGNLLYGIPSTQCIAAKYNPFVYKGYMYEEETGWYYLQTRYYMPSLCRFLSPDSIENVDFEAIGGLNLYAFCSNNHVMYNKKSVSSSLSKNHITFNYNNYMPSTIDVIEIGGGGEELNQLKSKSVIMTHYTVPLIENSILSCIIGNISYTVTSQWNSPDTFYWFSNFGNDGYSVGVGMNLGNWYGANAYISSDGGSGYSWQLTPWFTGSTSWSLKKGFSISSGIIIENTTYEITFSVGNGVLIGYAICALLATLPVPGSRIAAAGAASLLTFVDLFI